MPTRRDVIVGLATLQFAPGALSGPASAIQCRPRYQGSVTAKWLRDGRDMELAEPFEFISKDCRRWPVPKGTKINGASIPQIFWSLIGGPYERQYRDASVIHDFYCVSRTRRSEDVHRVFHEAMLVSKVRSSLAWVMYQAVLNFGPAWTGPANDDPRCDVVTKTFDFERCAQNVGTEPIKRPPITQARIEQFIKQVEGQAEKRDILTLREAARALRS